jgi:hypothetical protein
MEDQRGSSEGPDAFGPLCGCFPRSIRGRSCRVLISDAKPGLSERFTLEGLTLLKVRYNSMWGSCLRPRTPPPCYSRFTTKHGRSSRTRLPFGRSRESQRHNVGVHSAFVTEKICPFQPSTCLSDSPHSSLTLLYSILCPSAPENMDSAHNEHLASIVISSFRQKTNFLPTETCGLAFDTITTWYGHSRRHNI